MEKKHILEKTVWNGEQLVIEKEYFDDNDSIKKRFRKLKKLMSGELRGKLISIEAKVEFI